MNPWHDQGGLPFESFDSLPEGKRGVEEAAPVLVLATPVLRWPHRATPKQPDRWRWIWNQTAGVACHHVFMRGMVLTPRPGFQAWAREMHDKFTDAGAWGLTLTEAVMYRRALRRFSRALDCQHAFPWMEESFYPIDCTPKALKALCEDGIEGPDDLFEWGTPLERVFGIHSRWTLVVLAENSD